MNTIVKLISSFSSLDSILSQAILDNIIPPSAAPAILSKPTISVGSQLRVLQLFNIRGVAWLACLPVSEATGFASTTVPGAKPGFVPLKAIIVSGNPPSSVPREFIVPLHSSARSFSAVYRFLDPENRVRTASVRGVISSLAISYFEVIEQEQERQGGRQQYKPKWYHIQYSGMIQLQRDPQNLGCLILKLTESGRERELHVHLVSGNEAESFYQDVLHMHMQWLRTHQQ